MGGHRKLNDVIGDHMAENLAQVLIVLHPFHQYSKGDVIRDATTIAGIKASVATANFVMTSIPVTSSVEDK